MRSKTILAFLGLVMVLQVRAQEGMYASSNGTIDFTSNAELEVIRATSADVQGLLNPATNSFAFQVNINSFNGFNSDLQRQHFYENYMEGDKFARASFNGKIIESIDFSQPGTYEVRAKGELEIHGLKQVRIIRGTLTVRPNQVSIESTFTVPLSDHNIRIPRIVNQKIATEIDVTFRSTLQLP